MVTINWDTSKKTIHIGDVTLILKKIPIKNIEPFFVESAFSKSKIASLKKSIINKEIIPPIVLDRDRRHNVWMIYDGNHRYYAAKSIMGDNGYVMARVVKQK